MKIALITGILGQDGSYLAELLLSKGYEVHGLIRRNSNYGYMPNIAHIKDNVKLHYGDMADSSNLLSLISQIKPDEVYNLAAQSHVHVSFEMPEFTSDVNGVGVLRLLEAIRNINPQIKFYQASTSEMFGKVQGYPQNESTPFYPRSPYGVAKLYAYWITVNYRESYNLFACNGILFNHESPRRGDNFVTKKITKGFYNVYTGKQNTVELGNLDSKRDWGHASDYVEGMYLMLQHNKPDDYVLSTGKQYSVRDFCTRVAEYYDIDLRWQGTGLDEVGFDNKTGKKYISINKDFYRPAEVETLLGDSTKARTVLGWKPKHNLDSLVQDMCKAS